MMHAKTFPTLKSTAAILLAFFLASAAGPVLGAEEENAAAVCLRQLRTAIASLEFIFWDKPQIILPFLPMLLIGYEYCLRYMTEV